MHMIEGWKLMEHVFGAVAGGSLMLFFSLNSDKISQLLSKTDLSSLPLSGDKDFIGGIAVILMLFLSLIQHPVRLLLGKKGIKLNDRTYEMFERPLWSAFPLILIFMGSETAAAASAFITILYALCEKSALEWFRGRKTEVFVRISCAVVMIFGLLYFVFCFYAGGGRLTPAELTIMYTFLYTLPCFPNFFTSQRRKERKEKKMGIFRFYNGAGLVVGNFLIQSIIITLFVCFYFQN